MTIPTNLPTIAAGDWRAFADFIEALPANDDASAEAGFDMTTATLDFGAFRHPCGTAACIGGWANALSGSETSLSKAVRYFIADASADASFQLCYPDNDNDEDCPEAYRATPQQGATAIRNCAIHGEPRWREVMGLEVSA